MTPAVAKTAMTSNRVTIKSVCVLIVTSFSFAVHSFRHTKNTSPIEKNKMVAIFSMIDGWLIANPIIVVSIDDGK